MDFNEQMFTGTGHGGGFKFSGVNIDELNELSYTLVTIVCDISGSVYGFADPMLNCIKTIIQLCKDSSKAENLMVRVLKFNGLVTEVHGFKNVLNIDVSSYAALNPDGTTSLYDATYDAISATIDYSKRIVKKDCDCNGAIYIITDGDDNTSSKRIIDIKNQLLESKKQEVIESLITILIAVHDPKIPGDDAFVVKLKDFHQKAGLSEFIDVGAADRKNLNKLVQWVSESINSQSSSVGSGAASQILSF